jgi:hypothetical protein
MKITKQRLKEIIKEELNGALTENQIALIMESDPKALGRKLALMPSNQMSPERAGILSRNKLQGATEQELIAMMNNHLKSLESPSASESTKLTEPELAQLKKLISNFDGEWDKDDLKDLILTFNDIVKAYPEFKDISFDLRNMSRAQKRKKRELDRQRKKNYDPSAPRRGYVASRTYDDPPNPYATPGRGSNYNPPKPDYYGLNK